MNTISNAVSQKKMRLGGSGKEITNTSPLPQEILTNIFSLLPISGRINLAKTNYFNLFLFYASSVLKGNNAITNLGTQGMSALINTIFNFPEKINAEYLPCTPKGRMHLSSLGIGGPKMAQLIKEGLALDDALEIKTRKLKAIKEKSNDPDTTVWQRHNLSMSTIQEYIIDGSFSLKEGANTTSTVCNVLGRISRYIDDSSISARRVFEFLHESKEDDLFHFIFDLEISKLTKEQRFALIRRIDNYSLTLEQATNLISDARNRRGEFAPLRKKSWV